MIYEYTSTPYYRSTFLHVNRYAWYRCAPLSVATLVGGLVRVHVFHRAIPICYDKRVFLKENAS